MIAPQELRLGNLVTIDNPKAWPKLKDIPLTVIEISTEMDEYEKELFPESKGTITLQGEKESCNQFSQFIEPIELTEDWLLKFGFEKRENQRYYHKKYERTWVELTSILVKQFGNAGGEISLFDYVHQLQNIFFMITGEELTIKEQK